MGAQAKKKGPVKGGTGGRKANKQSSETAPSWALEQLALEQEEEESESEDEVRQPSPHPCACAPVPVHAQRLARERAHCVCDGAGAAGG